MTENTLSGAVVSGRHLRVGRSIDESNWAPYLIVALLERGDYDTLLAKQQLDPHSFLYNYQRAYPKRRNSYRTDPPKEENEDEIVWKDQDFVFPINTKSEQEILVELWNARPFAPKDELLGEARMGLRSLMVTDGTDGGVRWLTFRKRALGNDGGYTGGQIQLKFSINISPKLTDEADLGMLFPNFQGSVINIHDYISEEALEKMGSDKRKRQKVLFEIINTEKTYVRDLYMMNQLFVVRLKEKEILTREEISSVFANIPTLQNMHLELFKTLEILLEKDRSKTEEEIIQTGVMNDGLGDIFLSRANLFKHYAAYCSNHINIGVKIKALQALKPAFAEFLDECFKLPECRGLPIDSFLITPLQRMVKYPLLLDTLIKSTSEDHPDYATIKQALLEIKSVVDQVNKRTRQEARVKRMLDLQNQIVQGEAFNFLDRNRHVVKEGMARINGKDVYIILFNDVLAFTRKKKEKLDVKAVIRLKGKKWTFLTVVPSFKTAGSTIRKKELNDPVIVMIPEEDFVDTPSMASEPALPTITVSASMEAIPSPESNRGETPAPPSSSGYVIPSPVSTSSSPSPPSSYSAESAALPSDSPRSLSTAPPVLAKRSSSSGNLPMASSSAPGNHHGSASASSSPVTVISSNVFLNMPETTTNSNQFAEGGIYKFFFKTTEERNEWMVKFRKVAGLAATQSPVLTTVTSPPMSSLSPGDQSPKKSLTDQLKQKDARRRRSSSAAVTLERPITRADISPPPSSAGTATPSPNSGGSSGAPTPETSSSPRSTPRTPSERSGVSEAIVSALMNEKEAALKQIAEKNHEIAELKRKLEHEEALRKEVQSTCQILQKKAVDAEKDKNEKIKAEKESSDFLRADVVKRLHDIEKQLSEEREQRKREAESRQKLDAKMEKMWELVLDALNKVNAPTKPEPVPDSSPVARSSLPKSDEKRLLSWQGLDEDDEGKERAEENKDDVDLQLLSPRSRSRKQAEKEAKKKHKKEKKELKESNEPKRKSSKKRSDSGDSESDISNSSDSNNTKRGSEKRKSGSAINGASSPVVRTRAATGNQDGKKGQWRMSLWFGKGSPVSKASKDKAANGVSLETMINDSRLTSSENESDGSERDDSRDLNIKRKQMEKTSSWRSRSKNTASLPRTLSQGNMDKKGKKVEGKDKVTDNGKQEKKSKSKKESKKEQPSSPKEEEKHNAETDASKLPRLQRSSSSPNALSPRTADNIVMEDPVFDENDSPGEEEWEIESKESREKRLLLELQKAKRKEEDDDDDSDRDSSSDDESEGGKLRGRASGDDFLVGSPRRSLSIKDDAPEGAALSPRSPRSLSRSADFVTTQKVSKKSS